MRLRCLRPMLDPGSVDFKRLGFRAGIEVHHQIRSDRKLFCRCPPDLEENPKNMDYSLYRYFRPVLGEMGDFDPGMLVEFEKGYKVIYYACEHNTCTYEMDETPPFPPDHDAIRKKLEKFKKRWDVLKGPTELLGFLEKDFKKWYTQHISKWDSQTALHIGG